MTGSVVAEKILIVTSDMDTTADVMACCLTKRGIAFERLHPKDFPTRVSLSMYFDAHHPPIGSLTGPWLAIDWDEIKSIWYRRPERFAFPADLSKEEEDFAFHESAAVFTGMWRSLDVFWVNHPDRVRVAETKALQLKLARDLGMKVPQTLFTNDPQAVHRFYDELNGRVIYKTMTQGVLGHSKQMAIFATRLTADHLRALDRLKAAPGQFQEEIAKAFDLRITVIGDAVFAVEIHSPEEYSNVVDWRCHAGPSLRHVVHDLPDEIARFCRAMCTSLGLGFGAIDMVMTPDGEYVFLEINPNGQFGWLESITGLQLTQCLADLLAEPLGKKT